MRQRRIDRDLIQERKQELEKVADRRRNESELKGERSDPQSRETRGRNMRKAMHQLREKTVLREKEKHREQ